MGGWYNLDPLWASPNIDVVGIDAYFPLTDAPQQGYDVQAVIDGWTSGEGYDWYYADEERTDQQPLGAAYAWKNIAWWWSNPHVNPNGSTTSWAPESKPIWFTEYGFPSVDGATNQPNVFYDPTSSESYFPRFSRGRVDLRAQRLGLTATEQKWKDSEMIERMFIWTWDARPFPYWPDLTDVWVDGPMWKTGHWVEGKLGISSLAAIVADLCRRAGLDDGDFDVSRLTDLVEGFVVSSPGSARGFIEQLMQGFFFDAAESDGLLKFIPRGGSVAMEVDEQDLIAMSVDQNTTRLLNITRAQEVELPQKVHILYINRTANYLQGHQLAQRQVTESSEAITLGLPIVFSDQSAKILAEQWLYASWTSRTHYSFLLPVAYMALEPADIVDVTVSGATHRIRITSMLQSKPGIIRVEGVAEDVASYDIYLPPATVNPTAVATQQVGETVMELLDLPAFPYDEPQAGALRIAVSGLDSGWHGSVIYRSDDGGGSYTRVATLPSTAIFGIALDALPDGRVQVMDEVNYVDVVLSSNETLESVSVLAMFNGANVALIGNEVVQFATATLLEDSKYRLSNFLRGRLGTEHETDGHEAGERFLLLNNRLGKEAATANTIGLPRLFKPVTVGATLGATDAITFVYQGKAWKPYRVAHIEAERDGGGNLTISWIRRTRCNGGLRDNVDVPLNESTERYEIDIMDGDEVVRTLTVTTSTASYSAADQTTDFGAPQSSLTLVIYQISELVGRGYPAIATI